MMTRRGAAGRSGLSPDQGGTRKDLGIAGRHAIICAASKDLGKACAAVLARKGVSLTIATRTRADVEAAAEKIRCVYGVAVTAVAADGVVQNVPIPGNTGNR